jgi:Zn-dependent peptidase ImmA (M78 family)
MMTNEGYERFGDIGRFALDMRLIDDPDPEGRAPRDSVGSWGRWRLWVAGVNLCEYDLALPGGELERCDAATWYLAPLFRWLLKNWVPLLHEERLPALGKASEGPHARAAYLQALSLFGDEERFAPWQNWASRHSLRWAAEGGVLPDVFLRRVGDDIEISWGERLTPGGEAATFAAEGGVAHVAVADAAKPIEDALQWFLHRPVLSVKPWMTPLRKAGKSRASVKPTTLLSWFLDGQAEEGNLTRLFRETRQRLGARADKLAALPHAGIFVPEFAPTAAMFGTLSPEISREAGARLMAIAANASEQARLPRQIDALVENRPAWTARSPWSDGYRLAQDLHDDGEIETLGDHVDVARFVAQIGVTIHRERLGARGPRGVALAGDDLAPTIVVNNDHAANQRTGGTRFTLAHELCHLLHDRDRARRITHSSTPWAPAVVEQRANAFAAMLLMPPELMHRTLDSVPGAKGIDRFVEAARRMDVGVRAVIQHAANIDAITEEERDDLIGDLDTASTT